MQLKSLSILACIITLAFGSDVADVLNDLNNVQSAFTALDNTVKGFSNSISQANVNNSLFSSYNLTYSASRILLMVWWLHRVPSTKLIPMLRRVLTFYPHV